MKTYKKVKKCGYVYLLTDLGKDNSYKIGVTRGSIERRIKKLQTGNSGEIHMIKYHETDIPFFIEKHLHFKFVKDNIRNEWFELSDEDVFKFNDYCVEIEDLYKTMEDNSFFNKKLKTDYLY